MGQRLGRTFGDSVIVTLAEDAGTTGNFEITVAGTLVHSKASRGHTKLTDSADPQWTVVMDAIRAATG